MYSDAATSCSQIIKERAGEGNRQISRRRGEGVKEILACIAVSLVVTVITNKILAVHTFNVIDGYVNNLLEMTKETIRNAYLRK